MNALVCRTAQTAGDSIARDVTPVDQNVETVEDGGAMRQRANLIDRVARERERRKSDATCGVQQRSGGFSLLQRLTARQRQSFDVAGVCELRCNVFDVELGAAARIVRRGIEAAWTAKRAALQPNDEPRAWTVCAAARLDRVDADSHFAVGLGTDGVGRTPYVLDVTSISLSKRSGVMMLLSMPPDGTKPSSVPPDRRNASWLSVAARKL